MDVPADRPDVVWVEFEPGRTFADLDEWAVASAAQAPPLSDAQCALIRWAFAPAVEALARQEAAAVSDGPAVSGVDRAA